MADLVVRLVKVAADVREYLTALVTYGACEAVVDVMPDDAPKGAARLALIGKGKAPKGKAPKAPKAAAIPLALDPRGLVDPFGREAQPRLTAKGRSRIVQDPQEPRLALLFNDRTGASPAGLPIEARTWRYIAKRADGQRVYYPLTGDTPKARLACPGRAEALAAWNAKQIS